MSIGNTKDCHLTNNASPKIERGVAVVDIYSSRRGTAQSVSKSHCKVVFADDSPNDGGIKSSVETMPLSRLQVWTPQWEAAQSVSCAATQKRFLKSCALPKFGRRRPAQVWPDPPPVRESPNQMSEFLQFLKTHFHGNLVAAWLHIDERRRGRVDYKEFVRSIRSTGFKGNFQWIWEQLDPVATGFITLSALDSDAAELIGMVGYLFASRFPTLEDLWEKCLDENGSGRCTLDDFLLAYETVVDGDDQDLSLVKKLFKCLDLGGQGDLTMDELDILGLPRRKKQVITNEELVRLQKQKKLEERAKTVEHFKKFIISRFGSLVVGWRRAYDPDSDGKLQFSEFCKITHSIGFRGALKQLWRGLDNDNTGFVSLEELDPDGAQALQEFARMLQEAYGTLEDAWEKCLDPDGSGKAFANDVIRTCKHLKYKAEKPSTLYKYLDLSGEGSIDMLELEFLKIERRQEATLSAHDKLEMQKELKRAENEAVLNEFRRFLCSRFGNCVVGWRRHLDPDADGRMQFEEFCRACRKLGWAGNLKALWASLDTDDSKYVSLAELDPSSVQLIANFRSVILTFFSTAEEAWFSAFDQNGTGRVPREDFDDACKRMRISEKKRLFQMMDSSGTGEITFDEFELMELPPLAEEDEGLAKRFARDSPEETLLNAEAFFLRKFSNHLGRAWRWGVCEEEVDPDEHFHQVLSASQFTSAMRRLGFEGNLLCLWEALTNRGLKDPTETLSFCQFYPPGFKELCQFRNLLQAKFRNTKDCIFHLIEQSPTKKLTRQLFAIAAHEIGWEGDAPRVYDALVKENFDISVELSQNDLECLHVDNRDIKYLGDVTDGTLVKACMALADDHDPFLDLDDDSDDDFHNGRHV